MIDLFGLAAGNGNALQSLHDQEQAKRSHHEMSAIDTFVNWVEGNSRISINLRLHVLSDLISGKRYQNIYEWATEQSQLFGEPADAILRQRLKSFYDRRVSFDRSFIDGEKLRYAALNCGGCGLAAYGSYCTVLNKDCETALPKLAYLTGDSLVVCVDADGAVNEQAVAIVSAPRTHAGVLAAVKHCSEVPKVAQQLWPSLLFDRGSYLECIFIGDIDLSSIESVRIPQTDYQRVWDLAFSSFSKSLNDAERALVQDFVQLLRANREGKASLEII